MRAQDAKWGRESIHVGDVHGGRCVQGKFEHGHALCEECKTCECTDRLVCNPASSHCSQPLPAGALCRWEPDVHGSSGCAWCAEGFMCSDKGVRVRQSVKCGHCRRDWDCKSVMVCKMLQEDAGRGKCAMVMKESRRCYDSYWGCRKGLKCMRRLCRRSGRYLWGGMCGRIAWDLSVPGRRYFVKGSRGLRTRPQIVVLVRWG